MEEATFGRLEEIPKGRREFVRILTMVPVGMAINVSSHLLRVCRSSSKGLLQKS